MDRSGFQNPTTARIKFWCMSKILLFPKIWFFFICVPVWSQNWQKIKFSEKPEKSLSYQKIVGNRIQDQSYQFTCKICRKTGFWTSPKLDFLQMPDIGTMTPRLGQRRFQIISRPIGLIFLNYNGKVLATEWV